MKIVNILVLVFITSIITSCSSDSTPAGTNTVIGNVVSAFGCEYGQVPITGCWVTQQCAAAEDGDDMFLGYWVRGVYDFAEDGNINYAQLKYNNDSCTGSPFENSIFPAFFPETYVETGTEMTSGGLEGHRITYTRIVSNQTTNFDAIYIIVSMEDKICFTSNMVFGPNYNRYSALDPTPTIDYNECLLDINLFKDY